MNIKGMTVEQVRQHIGELPPDDQAHLMLELERGILSRFTFDPGISGRPVWSPDGNHIAFHSNRKGAFDLYHDPQLQHRRHFVEVPHSELGQTWVENSRFKLSRTPARVSHAAPLLGEHNQHVLEQILGYDEVRIAELVGAGALG